MGRLITSAGDELAALPDDQRPGTVIVAVMTDGYENASQEWTHPAIKALVEQQTKDYAWQFLYMGADQDAIEVGVSLGVSAAASVTYGRGKTREAMAMSARQAPPDAVLPRGPLRRRLRCARADDGGLHRRGAGRAGRRAERLGLERSVSTRATVAPVAASYRRTVQLAGRAAMAELRRSAGCPAAAGSSRSSRPPCRARTRSPGRRCGRSRRPGTRTASTASGPETNSQNGSKSVKAARSGE